MFEEIAIILGTAGAIVAIIAFFSPNFGSRLIVRLRRGPRFNWDSIPKKIPMARRRLWVLQTWLPWLRLELPYWHEALSNQNIDCRVLLLDQKLVQYRLRCRALVSSLLPQNVFELTELAKTYNATGNQCLEVRFYSNIPFGPIYVIDDDIYWGLYLADRDSMTGPVYHTRANSKLGRYILSSFEFTWKSASDTTGDLSFFATNKIIRPKHPEEEAEIKRRTSEISNLLSLCSFEDVVRADANTGCLCLVRHAETDLSKAAIFTGELDVGINSTGRKEARELSKHLSNRHWDKVYSSPLRRCADTLWEAIPEKRETYEIRDELRERALGDLEGHSKSDYHLSLPHYVGFDVITSCHRAPTNGESYCEVFWRVLPLLEEIINQVNSGMRVLVFSHEGPIRMMLMALDGTTIESAVTKEVHFGQALYYLSASTHKPIHP